MELILNRKAIKKAYTIGQLYVGNRYLCDILEPPCLHMKLATVKDPLKLTPDRAHQLKPFAIPEGRYPVVINYSKKFNQWLPQLIGVPLFQGIRIHAGNYPFETKGCLLPGENKRKGMVLNSRIWLRNIKELIVKAKEQGEAVYITVRSSER